MIGALTSFMKPEEGIWIDQCCINQTDAAEKRSVIGFMDLIYQSARDVSVVLEDIFVSAEEMQILDIFAEQHSRAAGLSHDASQPDREDQEFFLAAVTKITYARRLRRAWCFHELHYHKSCMFLFLGDGAIYIRQLQ